MGGPSAPCQNAVVELSRPRLREGTVERCPYCHDLLEEAAPQITCPGCATSHHVECVRELGRCTVFGCERPLDEEQLAEVARHRDSRAVRAVRQQLRQRARAFVRSHARRPNDREAMLERALLELDDAQRRGDRKAARAAADAVVHVEQFLSLGQIAAVRERVFASGATPGQPEPRSEAEQLGPDGRQWVGAEDARRGRTTLSELDAATILIATCAFTALMAFLNAVL